MPSRHITTEIIIRSNQKCDAIVSEIVNDDVGLYRKEDDGDAQYYLCIDPIPKESAEETVLSLCELIEGLSEGGRSEWKSAISREFYMGFEVSLSSLPFYHEHFKPSTLARVSALDTELGFALYPEEVESKSAPDEN